MFLLNYLHKSNRIHNLHIHRHIRNLNISPPTVYLPAISFYDILKGKDGLDYHHKLGYIRGLITNTKNISLILLYSQMDYE